VPLPHECGVPGGLDAALPMAAVVVKSTITHASTPMRKYPSQPRVPLMWGHNLLRNTAVAAPKVVFIIRVGPAEFAPGARAAG
jgi:hypothetical protein